MKLILINGTSGVGKTTLAKKVSDVLPMSFLLDLDEQRKFISHWDEHILESGIFSFDIALGIAEACLKSGRDFVSGKAMMDKVIDGRDKNVLDMFIDIGKKHGAEIFEIMLFADKDTVLDRAISRGFDSKPRLTPQKAEEYWEQMQEFQKKRIDSIPVNTTNLSSDEVFNKVRRILGI